MGADNLCKWERFQFIIRRLQSNTGMTTRELADELGVELRKIQRDLKQLREFNCPIEGPDEQQRYRIESQRGPATLLNLEETLAISLTIPLSSSTGLGNAAKLAWNKLHYAVLNGQERLAKNELSSLLSAQFNWSVSAEVMMHLSKALVEKRRLRMLYRKREAAEAQWRLVEPWQLFFQERWYVRGWEVEKEAIRSFRLDRVQEIQVLSHRYQIPTSESAADPHFHKWDLSSDEPTTVRCEVSESLSRWLIENPVHPTQLVDGHRFEVTVRDTDALVSWILGLTECRITGPERVQQQLKSRLIKWQEKN